MEERIRRELRAIVGREGWRTGAAQRVAYSYGGTFQQRIPETVLLSQLTEEVAGILALAHREKLPITARGAGTSLASGDGTAGGSLVLSLARMNRILEIDTANSVAVV